MKKTLGSFFEEIGRDQTLRLIYRADPIKALRKYGIEEMSFEELVDDDVSRALANLPGKDLEDLNAFSKILKFFADYKG